jgi:hypothetical protein
MMNDCPLVRSLEQIMSSGKPFVWMPGELPFLPIPVMMYRSLQMGANFIMPKGLKILCPSLEKPSAQLYQKHSQLKPNLQCPRLHQLNKQKKMMVTGSLIKVRGVKF